MTRIAGLLLLVAATAYALHRWTIVPWRCSLAASRASAALQDVDAANDYVKLRVARSVIASLAGCERVSPPNVQIDYTRAEALALLGDHRAAIAGYQRALTIDRRPEIYFDLGMSHLQLLDRQAAVDDLAHAVAFDPARLDEISAGDLRSEVETRVRERFGEGWLVR